MGFQFNKKEEPDKAILYKTPAHKKRPRFYVAGKAPNVLIGSSNYPNIHSGVLLDDEGTAKDNPKDIVASKQKISSILQSRQSLVNSWSKANVKIDLKSKFVEQARDVAMSKRAVDSEVFLQKAITSDISFHERMMPHGPSAALKKLQVTTNPSIPKPIDRLTSDTDVTATTALHELNDKGFDETYLTRLLSVGTLGQKRKLVPTKWSITAVDDSLSKRLRKEVLQHDEADFRLYTGEYLGNEFIIIVLPGPWSFELFELSEPHNIYNSSDEIGITQDHEFQEGRKTYASITAGAYYASKLGVLETFNKEKIQGRVIVFRVITTRYTVPLGVWVVREGVRIALNNKEETTIETVKQAKEIVAQKLKEKLGVNTEEIVRASKVLAQEQKSLSNWF